MVQPLGPARDGDGTTPLFPNRGMVPGAPSQIVRTAPRSGALSTTEWLNYVLSRIINRTQAPAQSRQLACAADRSVVPLVYGEDRLGALVLNVVPSGANVLVQCLWSLSGDSINDVKYNDTDLPAGSSVSNYANGGTNAAFVAAMAAVGITYSDTLTGYAYSVITMPQSAFTGSLSFSARIRGRLVYDPRSTLTVWSDCPALHLADFITNTSYGLGKTIDYSTVTTVANANDALVGGSEKRRMSGIAFISYQNANDVAETLRAYAGCFITQGNNGIQLIVDGVRATDATYSHASGEIARIVKAEKKDAGNTPTSVEVIFTDRTSIPWRDGSAVAEMTGIDVTLPRRLSQVSMPGIHRYSQAYREAVERLNKANVTDLAVVVDVFDKGIRHEKGDVIEVTHPIGFTSKKLRVGEIDAIGSGMWRLACAEYDPASYSDAIASGPTYPDTVLSNPAIPPATPTGFTYEFVPDGMNLKWTRNAELTVVEYEVRKGSTWSTATPALGGSVPTIVGGTSLFIPALAAASYTFLIKARTTIAVESTNAASQVIVITGPPMPTLSGLIVGYDVALTFTINTTQLAIAEFAVRYGSSWAAGAATEVRVSGNKYVTPALWSGTRSWFVAGIDTAGNYGTPAQVDVTVNAPAAPGGFRADVVDNNVLLYWNTPTASLPIDHYEVRKGATWAGGTTVGTNGPSNFTTLFESAAGTYTYWIAAFDSAGNLGGQSSVSVNVSAPPDFKLNTNFLSTFSVGGGVITSTKSNCVVENGKLYAPVNATETWSDHFTTNSKSYLQDFITAGYTYMPQPTPASGYLEEIYDYGAQLTQATITLARTGVTLFGTVTVTPQIWVSTDNISYTNLGNVLTAFATNFRYVKYRLTFTTADNGVEETSILNLRLGVKLKTLSGRAQFASADDAAGGTQAWITDNGQSGGNPFFVDVDSIVLTAESTTGARIPILNFTDTANPTNFRFKVYNDSGALVDGVWVRWEARGV